MIDIANLRSLLAAATPGEWQDGGADHYAYVNDKDGNEIADCGDGRGLDNAALIAAVKNALPELLDELERLRATISAAGRVGQCPSFASLLAVYEAACDLVCCRWLPEWPQTDALISAVDAARKAGT